MSGPSQKPPALRADKRYNRAATKPKAAAKPTAARKAKAKRGALGIVAFGILRVIGLLFRVVWGIGWRLAAVVALIVAGGVLYYATTLPDVEDLVDGRVGGSVTMLDQYQNVFAQRGDQYGGLITAGAASPHLVNAIVATEDRRFYWHPGIDPIGIANAVRSNLGSGGGGRGGSTLTQQTAKLLCNGRAFDATQWDSERAYEADCRQTTLWRKAQEATYALAMELVYTKQDILTIYINRAYMGGSSYGAEAAANRFFGASATTLNPQQSAMLAGLLQAPSRLSPLNNLERSQARSQTVMRLMHDQGYLDDATYAEVLNAPATLSEIASTSLPGGYFADWVMATGPEFFTRDTTEDVIMRTTLDPAIQQAAEDAVLNVFENQVRAGSEAQAAVVVMSADGAVRAMVGGTDVRASGVFNRATRAERQPGSAFKPFIFAAALDLGYSPNDVIIDQPTCWTTPGSGEWCPENYSRTFAGPVTLTQSLQSSLNIPAIVLSETVGRDLVRKVADDFGIVNAEINGPALALGVDEVTLLDITAAYAGILNGGSSVDPYGLIELRLRGDAEPLMDQSGGIGERVINEEAARQLTWMMHQVVEQGTGERGRIEGVQLAGKTGTTNGQRDAWFVGFSSDYVIGVWMGYDDNRQLTGVTGGGLPAEIWRQTMEGVLAGAQRTPLPMQAPEDFGNTLEANFDTIISDFELDLLLQQEFGSVPQNVQPNPGVQPAQPGGTTTGDTVNSVLDNIFGGN